MGKEKPVPPLPAPSWWLPDLCPLSGPLSNTQTWFHYPSQIRGYFWSCWGWIFLANLYKTSAYKYMLISVHCKISPTTRSGVESRWCPLSTPGIDPWNVRDLPNPLLHSLLRFERDLDLGRPSPQQGCKPASPLGRLNRTGFTFCTLKILSGVSSPFLASRASADVFTTVPRTLLCSGPWRMLMVRGFGTFLKYNVLLSPSRRLWSRFRSQSRKLGGVFEVAVTQRAGILDIQPFLKTSCMEEMTARRDHSRFHVLKKERLKEVSQKQQPFNFLDATP